MEYIDKSKHKGQEILDAKMTKGGESIWLEDGELFRGENTPHELVVTGYFSGYPTEFPRTEHAVALKVGNEWKTLSYRWESMAEAKKAAFAISLVTPGHQAAAIKVVKIKENDFGEIDQEERSRDSYESYSAPREFEVTGSEPISKYSWHAKENS